jgi:hypothetical protein
MAPASEAPSGGRYRASELSRPGRLFETQAAGRYRAGENVTSTMISAEIPSSAS